MAWLLTHMWMALAAVGFFSLLFGWSVRGILLVGKLRNARVDRDIARTELEQAKAEVEGLYAAQRGIAPGVQSGGDPTLKAELNVREKRLAELSSELARSKAELQSLRSGAGRGAAVVAAPGGKPVAAGDHEEPSMVWRNRHLESRVRHLESALHQQGTLTPVPAPAAVVASETVTDSDASIVDKLTWQADFLKQRVASLESELAAVQPAQTVSAAESIGGDPNEELARLRWRNRYLEGRIAYFEGGNESEDSEETDISVGEVEIDEDAASASDEILSRLEQADAAADAEEAELVGDFDDETDEGEEEIESDDDEDDDVDSEDDEDVGEGEESEDEELADDDEEIEGDDDENDEEESDEDASDDDEIEDDEPEDEDGLEGDDEEFGEADSDDEEEAGDDEEYDDEESDEESSDDDEDEAEDDDEEGDDEIEAERPIALGSPVDGAPDDLTIIGGIGPKIQEVLNELGIFHYDQIAAWSPENILWVDTHLNFSGRIVREGWVEQAAILSGDVAED